MKEQRIISKSNNFNKDRNRVKFMSKIKTTVIPILVLSAAGFVAVTSSVFGDASMKTTRSSNIEVQIFVDKKEVPQNLSDGMAYVTNGRTMVPLRVVTENMGYTVEWDNTTKKATIKERDNTVIVGVNSNIAYVNGQAVTLDAQSTVKNERTYVPLRFVSEALGSKVEYANKRVDITLGAGEGITTPNIQQNGFVGVNGMTEGNDYKLNQVFSNAQEKINAEWFDFVAKVEDNYNTSNVTVTKATWGKGSTGGVTFHNLGWSSQDKNSLATKVTGTVKEHIEVYFLSGDKIIGWDTILKDSTVNGYVLFGDVLDNTLDHLEKTTHIAFATMESGEVVVYQMPSELKNLNVYKK